MALLCTASALAAQGGDLFEFFAQEAQIVSASRRPQEARRAPATVYVVDGKSLSGAQTLWDLLRPLPGVDVIAVRSFQGAVSIRGLNKVVNNRTLVLVDGRTVLDGFSDNVNWEAVPVLLEDIERIEVVEGPASALYGANAVNGVINIITKEPTRIGGGRLRYAQGESRTRLASALYGQRRGPLGYKLGVGWRAGDRFSAQGRKALESAKAHALVAYHWADGARLSLRGGGTWLENDISIGGFGQALEEGDRRFARADYARGGTRLRGFWNGGTSQFEGTVPGRPLDLDYRTFDLNIERDLSLVDKHQLSLGAQVRRNEIDERDGSVVGMQTLWAAFFEDEWTLGEEWTLWSSGRLDRHPHVDWVFSPRLSLIFAPAPRHTLRFSTGASFRNPTLLENFIDFDGRIDGSELFPRVNLQFRGTTDLDPERLVFFELAHRGQWRGLRTTAAVFHYQLLDAIAVSPPELTLGDSALNASLIYFNRGEKTRAWGGELGATWPLARYGDLFANYSYQDLSGRLDPQVSQDGTPHHKVNAGWRLERGSWSWSAAAHWVTATRWNTNSLPRVIRGGFATVDGYALLNAHLAYRLPGPWQGATVGLDAFNLLDDHHAQILPPAGGLTGGQGGEPLRRRLLARLAYAF